MSEITKKQRTIEQVKTKVTLYPIKDLIDNCEALTKHKKYVAVGALFNCKKKEMSKDEFKQIVGKFVKTTVSKEGE